ncbi:hypothetical protein MKW92_002094 [Papaver armeniacum]|nr:hypothetical protein MKW92_002094 [Papaver armeniacum]
MSYEFHTSNSSSIHVLPFSLSNIVLCHIYFVLETSNGIIKTRLLNLLAVVQDLSSLIRSNLQKQTFAIYNMAERQQIDQQLQPPQQGEDMIACVESLEVALLPCLPAREMQAIDRSPHPSHQIDVERHARDFMEASKKLQLYFIGLQHEELPTKEETLRKDIAEMEEEIRTKKQLIKKHAKLILGWRKELKDQLDKHITELERV